MEDISATLLNKEGKKTMYISLDFEATCIEPTPEDFVSEIIEFPVQVLNENLKEIAKYRIYARPTINPTLTDFCTNLTGITQEQVNKAPTLDYVIDTMDKFIRCMTRPHDVVCLTYGDWDINICLRSEIEKKGIPMLDYLRKWINVKAEFHKFADLQGLPKKLGLNDALAHYGMTFQGNQHCGMDDTINTTRLLKEMISRGYKLENAEIKHY